MTGDRKIQANRTNARLSTGPKTGPGRARSAKNALRHGLSLSHADPAVSKEVDDLARQIAGPNADPEILLLARGVAEADFDVWRVRRARHRMLSQLFNDPEDDPPAIHRSKSKLREAIERRRNRRRPTLRSQRAHHLIDLQLKMFSKLPASTKKQLADCYRDLTTALHGSEKLMAILQDGTLRLSAFDRYERRALSRRKFAIRELGEVRGRTKTPPLASRSTAR
jgi:hypothetical protein